MLFHEISSYTLSKFVPYHLLSQIYLLFVECFSLENISSNNKRHGFLTLLFIFLILIFFMQLMKKHNRSIHRSGQHNVKNAFQENTYLWESKFASSDKSMCRLSLLGIHDKGWSCCSALILKGICIPFWNCKIWLFRLQII